MYHAIIISGKNTYDEWGLIPTARPVILPPEVKSTYVDLPASHGVLDYTDLLLGMTPFGQRKGSWEFVLRPGRKWVPVYTSLMNYLHGKRHEIILEDDPGFRYEGRLRVNTWKSESQYSRITIDYELDPFKQSVRSTETEDWQWNDLFDTTIRYGTFAVDGEQYRTFINDGLLPTTPEFFCSAPMSVDYGGNSFDLVAGRNYNQNLTLQPGDNIMAFHGTGTVKASYREVSL